MTVTAYSPDGYTIEEGIIDTDFKVKINEDLVPINIPGFFFVNDSSQSHPEDGNYLSTTSHEKLKTIVQDYQSLAEINKIPYITLNSEAASLSWGGVYDICHDRDCYKKVNRVRVSTGRHPWTPPHSGHRTGNAIDLSLSVFKNQPSAENLKTPLDIAIIINTLNNPYQSGEDPDTLSADHWHVYLDR
ncbi:MAG: hypothetical protein H7336_03415 [Bacteriovorax sp.]|nr:hypothetical protein [Bacteriovorax sp.]